MNRGIADLRGLSPGLAFWATVCKPAFCRAAEMSCVSHFVGSWTYAYEPNVTFAFANLPANSLILCMLVDVQYAYFINASKGAMYDRFREELPKDFLIGVTERHAELRGDIGRELKQCDFHNHSSDEDGAGCPRATPSGEEEYGDRRGNLKSAYQQESEVGYTKQA